jgi:dihydroneopterin aldolase
VDIVFITGLRLETIIGIFDWERDKIQPIILDIEMGCSIRKAVQSDNIKDSIDYFTVAERLKLLARQHTYQLVESFAEEVSRIILQEFNAEWVRVKLNKPLAVSDAQGVGVIIERRQALV